MNIDSLDQLKSLHTSSIDARSGYQEALEDAAGKGMTSLFGDMIELHDGNAAELALELTKANEIPDDHGSFMSVVHKTIMDVRSLFNGLDESVLPGLIDGEKRNVAKYDDALKAKPPTDIASLLTMQRDRIALKIVLMESQKRHSSVNPLDEGATTNLVPARGEAFTAARRSRVRYRRA